MARPGNDGVDPFRVLALGHDLLSLLVAILAAASWIDGRPHMVLAFKPPEVLPRRWMPPAAWAGAMPVAAPLALLGLCIRNAIAVVFPAWASSAPRSSAASTGVLLAVGLLMPVLLGAVVAFRFFFVMGAWAPLPAAVGAWLALIGECVGVVVLLGQAYDRMDPPEARSLA